MNFSAYHVRIDYIIYGTDLNYFANVNLSAVKFLRCSCNWNNITSWQWWLTMYLVFLEIKLLLSWTWNLEYSNLDWSVSGLYLFNKFFCSFNLTQNSETLNVDAVDFFVILPTEHCGSTLIVPRFVRWLSENVKALIGIRVVLKHKAFKRKIKKIKA